MIRIVGLSATLPNYQDVARFLGVNEETGLFYFDAAYRAVPLTQNYVGVMETNIVKRNGIMNDICFEKVCQLSRPTRIHHVLRIGRMGIRVGDKPTSPRRRFATSASSLCFVARTESYTYAAKRCGCRFQG
jgi:Lhr-like helicase